MPDKDESFVVDPIHGRALQGDREVHVGPKTFALLSYLMQHRDRVVTREELRLEVAHAELASDAVVATMMTKLRRALGDEDGRNGPIETVRGNAYRIRSEPPKPAPSPRSETSLTREARARAEQFVGRDSTLGMLGERLARAHQDGDGLLLLIGDAGIGKTRVARELCSLARARGLLSLFACAHDEQSAPPYGPWIQLLHAAHDELGTSTFERCLPGVAWPLGLLAPELCPISTVAPSMEPQAARFCLFEAFASFLKKVAAQQPLLLVLDDVQCADEGTIDLLTFLTHALQGQRLTLLATLRTEEAREPWQANTRLGRLSGVATMIELAGLSVDAVAKLTSAFSGAQRPELSLALHARTGGNPLFVCQSLSRMHEHRRWSLDPEPAPDAQTPPPLRQLMLGRLRRLPEPSQAALAAAAVIGKGFDMGVLATVLSKNIQEVFDLLEPALRLGAIERDAGTGLGLSFAHALVRDGLYEALTTRERGTLHGHVARALEQRRERNPHEWTALAHHRLHAAPADLPATVAACRRAAAAARAAASFADSTRLIGAALKHVARLGGDAELRFELLLELGEDYFYAGHSLSAWAAFRSAAESAQSSARADLLAQVAPRLLDCTELGLGDRTFVRELVEQALTAMDAWPERIKACLLAYRSVLMNEQTAPAAQALAEQAASLAERSNSLGAKLEVAHVRAMTRDPHRLSECMNAAQDFLALSARHPMAATKMRYGALRGFSAHLTRYVCALTMSDLPAADLYLEQCRQIAESSHVRPVRFVVALARAGRALGEGRLVELRELIARLAPQGGSEVALERAAWRAYEFALLETQGNASLEVLDADAALIQSLSGSKFLAQATITRARQLAVTGNLTRARALLALIPRAWADAMPTQCGDLGALCSLAEVQLMLGDEAALVAIYQKLSPFSAHNAVGPLFDYRGAVAHFLGLVARRVGDAQTALDHFREAVAVNGKLNMPRQLAASEAELRRCLDRTGKIRC